MLARPALAGCSPPDRLSPGARHDMGALREHGTLNALNATRVRAGVADNGYH
jgi:hypothetical protein